MRDDVAQDVMTEFYSMNEFDQPKTENEFIIWASRSADRVIQQKKYSNHKEISNVIYDDDESESEITTRELAWHHQAPTQILYVTAMEALRMISNLPEDMRRKVMSVIDSGDVVEFASENNINLFDAMKEMQHVRTVMKRIADDMSDEKKFI